MSKRREFVDSENRIAFAFSDDSSMGAGDYGFGMDTHQVRRALYERRVLHVSRHYRCECGHVERTPQAVWEHVATHRPTPPTPGASDA